MKIFLTIFIFLLVSNCSKPKTVLICGDHVCINKAEAEQFVEENLTLEVKIVDKKIKKDVDLIELNLKESSSGNRKVTLLTKKDTTKQIKVLSKEEKTKIKRNIINKKRDKKKAKKSTNKYRNIKNKKELKKEKILNNMNKKNNVVVDVCTILDKCSIEEISKFLLEQGKNKDFPDLTLRQ